MKAGLFWFKEKEISVTFLLSNPYPSVMGASLVSSLFSLGLGINIALPATLSSAGVFVAEGCPWLQVGLHNSVDMDQFVWATYPFH